MVIVPDSLEIKSLPDGNFEVTKLWLHKEAEKLTELKQQLEECQSSDSTSTDTKFITTKRLNGK